MPDRDVTFIGDLIYYQYAKIIAKNAFAAPDGESSLKLWGDKKFYDSIPPLLPSAAAATAQVHSQRRPGRGWRDNGAGYRSVIR